MIIHHNPDCGTSRNVVRFVRDAGYEPEVIEYLKTGWTRPQLLALFAAANLCVREALRETKSPAAEPGLLDPSISDDDLLEAMVRDPILVNRLIVATPRGIKLCRPSEAVFTLLARLPPGPIYKDDGELVITEYGKLVNTS